VAGPCPPPLDARIIGRLVGGADAGEGLELAAVGAGVHAGLVALAADLGGGGEVDLEQAVVAEELADALADRPCGATNAQMHRMPWALIRRATSAERRRFSLRSSIE
jgi:hypothetical protein